MERWVSFSWESITGFRRHHLPHVTQPDAVYFITFRLNDSVPADRIALWQRRCDAWLSANPPPHDEAQREALKDLGFRRIEKYLNGGHGSCLLRDGRCREIVSNVLHNRDGEEYRLGGYVIMPNHVHVIMKSIGKADLSKVIGAWKAVSAHRINKRLERSGSMWQDEWFDHIVRSPQALFQIREYIRGNPRHLPATAATTGCGSFE